jgi:hypothetical protein
MRDENKGKIKRETNDENAKSNQESNRGDSVPRRTSH